jgi:EAL and modified HD-GYP domain-containing signal transduction protein
MSELPALGQLTIGYCPMMDRQRSVVAVRLTVFPERADAPPDAAPLLQALNQVFPPPDAALALTLRELESAPAGAGAPPGGGTPVLLNIASERMLDAVLADPPPVHVMLEVPAFMVADPARAPVLRALRAGGHVLAIKGRPVSELPRDLLPCFRHAIVDLADDRRGPNPGPAAAARTISTVSSGVHKSADLEAAWALGAQAAIGWPIEDDLPKAGGRSIPPDLRGIVELMNRVDRDEPAERMEHVLKADPTLAFRLMRYINSAAFGLRVEVTSFKHALMLLGYSKLKRWLALLLASGSKDQALRPVMYAAVRRGLIMEELARSSGDDEMRGEMFICGVFSLLDRMMRQPFDELLKSVPVQERVQASLMTEDGPYTRHLELVRAMEQGSAVDIREHGEQLLLAPTEINRALFAGLAAARELD